MCHKIYTSVVFDDTILVIIILSSIKQAIDTYYVNDSSEPYITISDSFDIFFTCAFTIEASIKSITMGFVLDKGTYLRQL